MEIFGGLSTGNRTKMSEIMKGTGFNIPNRVRAIATLRKPLFANAGYLMGITVVNSLAGFLFWGLAARLYRPEDVGTASAVISVITLLSGIASLGVGDGLVRFLPESLSPIRLINTVLTFTGVVSLLVAGGYLAGLKLWSPSLAALRQNNLYLAGFLTFVAIITLSGLVQTVFVSHRRAGYALAHTCMANGGRIILIAALATLGAAGVVGSVALAAGLTIIISLFVLLSRVEPGYRPRMGLNVPLLVTILPYSMGNHIAGLLARAPQMIMPLLILEKFGPASSGHAYVAWMLGSFLYSPGLALAQSAFVEGSNTPQKLDGILSRASVMGLALTLPAALAMGVLAPWLLRIFGPSYALEAVPLLRWMAAAAPLLVLTRLYFTYLRVRKRVGRLILLGCIVAAVTFSLAVGLMSRFGIVASGVGWLVGNGLMAAIAVERIWKDLTIRRRVMRSTSIAKGSWSQK